MSIQEEIPNDLLANLIPLNGLSYDDRQSLLKRARLDTVEVGKRIPAHNGEQWHSYLIEGSLYLIGEDVILEDLDPQSAPERVRKPIFANLHVEQPIDYAVITQPTRLLSIRREAIEKLTEASLSVEEANLDPVEYELLNQLYQVLNTGQLNLPSMPEVAVRVRSLSNDPDSGPSDIAKVVQTDPSLAARIIQAANSAAYRGARAVDTIKEAITRLGLKRSQNLAMSIALNKNFNSNSSRMMTYMRQNWNQSVEVSAIAYVIAHHIRHIDPDRALLGGLLHRIGVVPILLYLETSSATDNIIETASNRFTPMISGLLLQEWGFEKEFILAAEESENWTRDASPEPDLCDVILSARLYANLPTSTSLPIPAINEMPAFNKLGLGSLESDNTLKILEDAKEEIDAIRDFLS